MCRLLISWLHADWTLSGDNVSSRYLGVNNVASSWVSGMLLLCASSSNLSLILLDHAHQRNDYTLEAVSDGSTALIKPLKNDFSFL